MNNASQLIKNLLLILSSRHKKVIEGRYGLASTETKTLAELGNAFSLTRERIRQIEALALRSVKEKVSKETGFPEFIKTVSNNLQGAGNVKREDLLLKDLISASGEPSSETLSNKLRFLLEICGAFNYAGETDLFYPYWYIGNADQKRAAGFVAKIIGVWKVKKNIAGTKEFYKTFVSVAKSFNLDEAIALNYASLSKKIAINCYGDLGPAESREIKPQTSRDWAYLVLKKEQKPLHFVELANLVSKSKSASIHAPTVHNELIKDNRFVLVGKGTYSLTEWGIVPGTAKEIIAHYIKKHGPLKAKDVVQLVLKDRLFKENTVLINLQNKKHFRRLDDGRYTVLV